MAQERALDEQKGKIRKSEAKAPEKRRPTDHEVARPGLSSLQQLVGNRAVQRLLAQRSGEAGFELDDDTADRINRARGGGEPLDTGLQQQASTAMGYHLSGVRVHTSSEADDLSQQLGARAFTTGQDVFFREGAYDPHSSSGRELIAHELTHVVQQSSGAMGSTGKMTVRPPGDVYEQEADAIAPTIRGRGANVQRQGPLEEEEEETIQRQLEEEEEEELQR